MEHTISLSGYEPSPKKLKLGTNDSYGVEKIIFTRGAEWDGLSIVTVWHPPGDAKPVSKAAFTDDTVYVPKEATATAGRDGVLVVEGLKDGVRLISYNISYTVKEQAGVEGDDAPEPTPDLVQQAIAAAEHAADHAKTAQGSADTAAKEADNARKASEESAKQAEAAKEEAAAAKPQAEAAAASAKAAANSAKAADESAKAAQQVSQGAVGYYATESALNAAHPTAKDGNWAIVGTTDTIWVWDSDTERWKDTNKQADLSNYYPKNEIDKMLAAIRTKVLTVTAPAAGWVAGSYAVAWDDGTATTYAYRNRVTVEGVTADSRLAVSQRTQPTDAVCQVAALEAGAEIVDFYADSAVSADAVFVVEVTG